MTTHRYRRCSNCQDVYTYQASGHGAPKYNNPDYCPTCQEVIVNALRTIPQKFGRFRTPLADVPQFADVTREQIEAWYAEDQEAQRKIRESSTGFASIQIRPIYAGLINLQTGDHQDVRRVKALEGPHVGAVFWITVWEKSGECELDVDMERDILNDRIVGPWKEYSRTL